ncbi:MAG TPA: hypothetical protein DD381_08705 [Lentisphaeria bacterium]|nr:MAG: hypothetical protein A2X47_08140 [Lentisphaerae bacterium GWF2_38_69]HBM16403.1 hypothetical protein [Lentisphaeria bacterium]
MQSSEITDKYYLKVLIWICVIWFLVWSFVPFIFFEGIFSDIFTSSVVIKQHLTWGYNRQPYFGTWLSGGVFLFGDLRFGYLCCQIFILICILSIWKLARYFLPRAESLIAVLLVLVTPTFSFLNLVFCQNVMLMGFWALIILFFYKALLNQKYIDWLLLGLFCGLGLMTKYFCAFLFVPMALLILFTKEGRSSFTRLGLYFCGIVFLIAIIPNIIWLFDNQFVSVTYGLKRTDLTTVIPLMDHIFSPLKSIGLIVGNLALAIILVFACFPKRNSEPVYAISSFTKKYINLMCLTPLLILILFAVITGGYIKPEWLFPLSVPLGVFAVMYWRPVISKEKFNKFLVLASIVLILAVIGILFAIMYYYPYKHDKMEVTPYPTYPIANVMTEEWHKEYHQQLKYVIGEYQFAAIVSYFGEDHPTAIVMDPLAPVPYSQYMNDIKKYGALLIWRGSELAPWMDKFKDDSITKYHTKAFSMPVKPWFERLIKNWTGEIPKTQDISFAFIPPQNEVK